MTVTPPGKGGKAPCCASFQCVQSLESCPELACTPPPTGCATDSTIGTLKDARGCTGCPQCLNDVTKKPTKAPFCFASPVVCKEPKSSKCGKGFEFSVVPAGPDGRKPCCPTSTCTPSIERVCCKAFTAKCLACSAGIAVEAYCAQALKQFGGGTPGCPKSAVKNTDLDMETVRKHARVPVDGKVSLSFVSTRTTKQT